MCKQLKIYTDDLSIAKSILHRDEAVTRDFFYKKSYPLFKSIFDKYYTDCHSCLEFMNEIYVLILKPSKITGHCQLENYKGESTLTNWLKSACLFYCYGKYRKKVVLEPIQDKFINGLPDRFQLERDSINIDTSNINEDDIENIIQTMSNRRYQEIIRLKYLRHYSNEEVATLLGMTIDNFYNKHRLAKIQFENMLKKEVRDEL